MLVSIILLHGIKTAKQKNMYLKIVSYNCKLNESKMSAFKTVHLVEKMHLSYQIKIV